MQNGLVGDEKSLEFLTRFQAKQRKRGAPCQIEDSKLYSRRDHILGALELHWAEVGWELQHARTPEQVRAALKPIAKEYRYDLELFLCDTPLKCTQQEFRRSVKALDGLKKAARPAYEELEDAKEKLQRVEYAVKESPTEPAILQQLKFRKQRFEKACDAQQEITERFYALRDTVEKQRAYLAQNKILGFIGCKRYEMTPTGFANGMAGLPEIDWRQSSSRCRKKAPSHPHRNIYEMFLEIERALPEQASSIDEVVEHAKGYLRASSKRNAYAKQLVPYHVRVAIEVAYSKNPRRDEAPYRIFTEYMRRTSHPTNADMVFAEEEPF